MPDHVHLFAQPQIGSRSLASWMQTWKSVTARQIARAMRVNLPVWQTDEFDRYLRSTDSYPQEWEYVSANAVRAKLVEKPEDWPYTGRIFDLIL